MFSRNHFSDLDEMLQSLVGWNLDFLPLEKGKFPSRIGQYLFEDTFIGEANFFKKVEQRGATPEGYRTFVVPKDDRVNYHWRGREIDGHTLSLFPPSGELYSVSNGTFRVFTISFSFKILEKALDQLKSRKVETLLKTEYVWKASPPLLHRIRVLIGKMLSNYDKISMRQELELELVLEILSSMNQTDPPTNERRNKRDRALVKCIDMIQSSRHEGILHLSELCKESEVSERTLQYAFKERYGLSPKEYIKNYNLHQVRKLLQRGHEGGKIREVAAEFGFWHMGQFASDYKRHFGELPSKT